MAQDDETNSELIGAIDEALDIAGDGAASDGAGGSPAAGDAEGAADEGGDGEGTEAGGEGEHGEGAEGDGKDGGEGGEGKPGEKPGEKSGDKPAAKKPDAINDPIPKELNQETQQRIRTLIKTTKEVTQRAEQAESNFNVFVQGLQAANVTPDQYQETLSFFSLFNSRDPQQQMKALELVEGIAENLSMLLGVERQSKDPLADFPELARDVQAGKITREYAVRLARQQQSTRFRQQLQSEVTKGQETQATQQRELATARQDLNALEKELRAKDPRFEEKRRIIVPALKAAFKRLPPSAWRDAFLESYQSLRLPVAAAPAQGRVPANQPLRARQPAGGGKKAPASMLDAINAGIEQASGR